MHTLSRGGKIGFWTPPFTFYLIVFEQRDPPPHWAKMGLDFLFWWTSQNCIFIILGYCRPYLTGKSTLGFSRCYFEICDINSFEVDENWNFWIISYFETYYVRIFPPPWSRTHPGLYFCLLVIFRRPFTFVCCHFAKMFCVSVIRLLYHIFLSQWNPRNHCNLVYISFF